MPYKDPSHAKANQVERSRRYRERQRLLHPRPSPGKHGNHAKGSNNGRWNPGKLTSSHGYVLVRVPKDHHRGFGPPGLSYAYAYEHDLVMEHEIGRHLISGEIVHHKNEKKQDNSPSNLEIKTLSEHMRHHDALRGRDTMGRFRRHTEDLRIREFPATAGQPKTK